MPTDDRPKLELHIGSGEWSALYVDGKLDVIGDHYLADEHIRELCGVTVVESDDFLRGGDGVARKDGPGPARTLDEVYAYVDDRNSRKARADRLREQAADLVAEAARIERGEVL